MSPMPTHEQLRSTWTPVFGTVWIGGDLAPVPDGVRTVVTLEATAPPVAREGVTEHRFPFRDSRWEPVPREPLEAAVDAVVQARRLVLVRCQYGLNRSALVLCLALPLMSTTRRRDAIAHIRRARPGALTNPYFADLIRSYPKEPFR
jgi:protein-tyrosine phosphatase